MTAMTTDTGLHPERSLSSERSARRGVHAGRLVLGILVAAAGIGWLLDELGVLVPWHLYAASAVTLIGLALLVTLLAGRGRGLLIGMGVMALIVAGAVGIGAGQYAGPMGDTFVAPTVSEWPVSQRIGAGTVTVDLTRHPLPEAGTATIEVGAGRIVVTLPADDSRVQIDARIAAGTVRVDGEEVADGVDVQWSQLGMASARIPLTLRVGLGDIEVNHE